jgi:hypothetical protein
VGAADRAASWILLKPYRCLDCNKRFHGWTPRVDSTTRRRLQKLRRSKATRRQLAMYGIASVILAAIIYYAVQQRISSGG